MNYYRAALSGKIFSERQLRILDDIFGDGSFEGWVHLGALVHVEDISVIDFLKSNDRAHAAILYRDIHDCSLATAAEQVRLIEADMARFSKK